MAVVSGQSVSSFAELDPTPYADPSTAEDSDDEYVYVSSLAEQIAHDLVLDDDEEPPSLSRPSRPPSFYPELRHQQGNNWPSTNLLIDQEFVSSSAEMILPVSNSAAAWRDHGPSEWDCFYTPSLQQISKQHFTLYTTQLELKRNHMSRGWKAACLANNKQANTFACQSWDIRSEEAQSTAYNSAPTARKESIGTGVFLPKIFNPGPHYRRRVGFPSSKHAYAPRHKC